MGAYGYDRFLRSSVVDLKSGRFYAALLGEMIGVLVLVFIACSTPYGVSLDITRIGLGFGLTVATMVWILADVSGGHINPAVTTGMFVTRKISLVRFLLYIVVQCIGGLIGAYLIKSLSCDWQVNYYETVGNAVNYTCGLGMTYLSDGVTVSEGIVIELILTFILVSTVFAACDSNRSDLKGSGPLAIGLSVVIGHLAFVPLTGPSMNPARTFGPAVALAAWDNHYVYWIGPISGGVLAALLYEFLFAADASLSKFVSWIKDIDPDYVTTRTSKGSVSAVDVMEMTSNVSET